MKKTTSLLFLLLAGIIVTISSCEYEVEAPVPSAVDLNVAFSLIDEDPEFQNARVLSRLEIQEATMNVKKLDVRILGNAPLGTNLNRNFSFDFPDPKTITYKNTEEGSEINIAVPRATYRQFMFDLDIAQKGEEPAASMKGIFQTSDGFEAPVSFELYGDLFSFDGKFEAKDKNNVLDFNQIETAIMMIELYAKKWFNDLDERLLDSAEIVDGVILINPDHNTEIYEFVKGKIQELSEIKLMIKLQQQGKSGK